MDSFLPHSLETEEDPDRLVRFSGGTREEVTQARVRRGAGEGAEG
jgi:hypothetical protein